VDPLPLAFSADRAPDETATQRPCSHDSPQLQNIPVQSYCKRSDSRPHQDRARASERAQTHRLFMEELDLQSLFGFHVT
jgi:hypothetical protein